MKPATWEIMICKAKSLPLRNWSSTRDNMHIRPSETFSSLSKDPIGQLPYLLKCQVQLSNTRGFLPCTMGLLLQERESLDHTEMEMVTTAYSSTCQGQTSSGEWQCHPNTPSYHPLSWSNLLTTLSTCNCTYQGLVLAWPHSLPLLCWTVTSQWWFLEDITSHSQH